MAGRSVDWTKLGWCMTQNVQVGATPCSMFANGGARFAAFKTESDAVSSAFAAANKRAIKIDFEEYKKALPHKAAWVAEMEKKYNSTNIPKPVDTLSESIAADDSKVAKAIVDAQAALDVAAEDSLKELKMIKNMAPVGQLTFADIYRIFPELNPFTPEEMHVYHWDPQWTRNTDLQVSDMRGDNVDGERKEEEANTFRPKAIAANTDPNLDSFGFKREQK